MKVYIFHGWGGNSEGNWFPWLKHELESAGIEVEVPDFPDSKYPKLKPWLNEAMKLKYDENTVLVGHSLGCVLIMRLIEKNIKLKSAYLVANFDRTKIPEIQEFFAEPFNYEKIKRANLTMLTSDNDPYIPFEVADRLSKKLGCKHKIFKGARHLNNGTGNLKFPELKEMIVSELN